MSALWKRVGRSGAAPGAGLASVRVALGIGGALLAGIAVIAALVGTIAAPARGELTPRCQVEGGLPAEVPARFVPLYERATDQYGLGPRGVSILAAIHAIESGFGANMGPSSAGAVGQMQFMPATWAAYGVDGDGDGRRDPYDPEDAIPAAARYLRASGAPADWRSAIFAYNHASWYVADVLERAERYQGAVSCELVAESGATLRVGRIDWTDTAGAWAGSKKFADLAKRLAARIGCSPISAKRDTQTTSSGGISDHWSGATHSFAYDLAGCSSEQMDRSAEAIADAFALPASEGVVSADRGQYRVQLLWRTYVGGDHYTHVHVGIRNRCCLAAG